MGLEGCTVMGFTRAISQLNLSLFKEDIEKYNAMRDYVEIQEFNKGFKIKKVNKPTKKGTDIEFVAIENEDDYKKCYEDITTRLAYMLQPIK